MDFQEGPWSNVIQGIYGSGYDDVGDVWGISLMPARFIHEDKVQLVARYQYANSRDSDGLRWQKRYEREVATPLTGERGDRYHAGYLGLNWYLYGNKLKIMSGVEYSHMSGGSTGGDFSGWTWFNGIRVYF